MLKSSRRTIAALGTVAALAVPVVMTASAPANAAPYCGITWGSTAKATSPMKMWSGKVTAVRAGAHACYDRLVFDLGKGSGTVGYNVRYVNTVTSPGSGLPVPVAGGAKLQVTINAPSTLGTSTTNYSTSFFRTLRQTKNVGSYEGYTDYGVGVRARLPMRVMVLNNTDGSRRLVVDVAHRW